MQYDKTPEVYEINFDCGDCADDGSCMVYGHPCSGINCTEKNDQIEKVSCVNMLEDKELIKLWKNNETRNDFLKAYSDWGVWLTTKELELTYYRYELPNGTTIIAMEHQQRKYSGYNEGYIWDTAVRFYVQAPNEPFSPNSNTSISGVAELLKAAKVSLQGKSKPK